MCHPLEMWCWDHPPVCIRDHNWRWPLSRDGFVVWRCGYMKAWKWGMGRRLCVCLNYKYLYIITSSQYTSIHAQIQSKVNKLKAHMHSGSSVRLRMITNHVFPRPYVWSTKRMFAVSVMQMITDKTYYLVLYVWQTGHRISYAVKLSTGYFVAWVTTKFGRRHFYSPHCQMAFLWFLYI